jgi:hypothetical protein
MGGGSEVRSNAEDSRSAFDELSFPIGVRRFDSCPPHQLLKNGLDSQMEKTAKTVVTEI